MVILSQLEVDYTQPPATQNSIESLERKKERKKECTERKNHKEKKNWEEVKIENEREDRRQYTG